MSRSHKMWLFSALAILCGLFVAVIVYEMTAPRLAVGGPVAPPVTSLGWLQLAISTLGAFGFTGAGLWQAISAFLETRLPAVVQRIAPNAPKTAVNVAIDVSELTALLVLIKSCKDPGTADKLREAARMRFDSLRDETIPLQLESNEATT